MIVTDASWVLLYKQKIVPRIVAAERGRSEYFDHAQIANNILFLSYLRVFIYTFVGSAQTAQGKMTAHRNTAKRNMLNCTTVDHGRPIDRSSLQARRHFLGFYPARALHIGHLTCTFEPCIWRWRASPRKLPAPPPVLYMHTLPSECSLVPRPHMFHGNEAIVSEDNIHYSPNWLTYKLK